MHRYFILCAINLLLVSLASAQVPLPDIQQLTAAFAKKRQAQRDELREAGKWLKARINGSETRLQSILVRQGQDEKNRSMYMLERKRLEFVILEYQSARREILIALDRTYRPSSCELDLLELARRPHLASPLKFEEIKLKLANSEPVELPPLSKVIPKEGSKAVGMSTLSKDAMLAWIVIEKQLDSERFQMADDRSQLALVREIERLCRQTPNFGDGWICLGRALNCVWEGTTGKATLQALVLLFPENSRHEELRQLIIQLIEAQEAAAKN